MTRNLWTLMVVAGLATVVSAQTAPPAKPLTDQAKTSFDPQRDAQERERILSERESVRRQSEEAEADCYQKFAVSACVKEVRKQRRVGLEALRKQELALNDARRAAASADQTRKVQERLAEKDGVSDSKGSAERPQSSAQKAPGSAVRPTKTPTPSVSEQQRLQAERDYQERQRLARERQLEREKRLQSGGSRPLPVPP